MGKVCCTGAEEASVPHLLLNAPSSESRTPLSLGLHHALALQAKCQQQTPERNPVWKSHSSAVRDGGCGHV